MMTGRTSSSDGIHRSNASGELGFASADSVCRTNSCGGVHRSSASGELRCASACSVCRTSSSGKVRPSAASSQLRHSGGGHCSSASGELWIEPMSVRSFWVRYGLAAHDKRIPACISDLGSVAEATCAALVPLAATLRILVYPALISSLGIAVRS